MIRHEALLRNQQGFNILGRGNYVDCIKDVK
jgi:hypothetical protein